MKRLITGMMALLALGIPHAGAADLTARTETVSAQYNPDSGLLRLMHHPSQKVFFQRTTEGAKGSVVSADDSVFGRGECIQIVLPNGNTDTVMLFPGLHFALLRTTLQNAGKEVQTVRRAECYAGQVNVGYPAARLKTLGTGGLLGPDKNPGSYVWQAIAEPASRNGVVCGWLTHDRGSGVVFTKPNDQQVSLEAVIDYGRLRIEAGQSEKLETFAIGYFDDARLGLEEWADAVARIQKIKLRPQPVGYCTWYSQPHGGASDEKSLEELTVFSAKNLAPFGFSVVQIDDGWQNGISSNGPHRNFFTHRPKGSYASGMKKTADMILSNNLVPGIWFMPFAGTYYDPFFKEHQDWFVKGPDGRPFETACGGTCLDMTHPEARQYLADNARRIRKEWGYLYYKMDGLWTGTGTRQIYVNSGYRDDKIGETTFHNPRKTNIEAYRDGLKLVRDAAGDDVFFLGCCAPQNMRSYGAAMGLVDAMRIGPDNGASWDGLLRGPLFGSRHYFLHGRVWYNDPDPVYVRASVPLAQAQLICSWVAVSGQLNLSSEWLPGLSSERLDILKRTMPPHGLMPRPIDLFEEEIPAGWLVTDTRQKQRRDLVALFNWSAADKDFEWPLARIGLDAGREFYAFDYWNNQFVPVIKGNLKTRLPRQSCQVLSVRPVESHPVLLGTSRHITQGMVDVMEEVWDESSQVLQGRSRIVGEDPYELRIAAMRDNKTAWPVLRVEVSQTDKAAGVKAEAAGANGFIRVKIQSPSSREVSWKVYFGKPVATASKPASVSGLRAEAGKDGRMTVLWNSQDGVRFELACDGGEAVPVPANQWLDVSGKAGQKRQYKVCAVDWAGQRSDAAEITVTLPKPPELPVLPPKPEISIQTLKALKATTGWGSVQQGKSVAGRTLKVAGKSYADGIGVHAPSELIYERKPEYARFVAVAGIDEEIRENDRSSLIFKVIADNGKGKKGQKVLAASPELRFGQLEQWRFDVAIPKDCKQLHLVVDDAGDGINSDHGDWVDAGFILEKK